MAENTHRPVSAKQYSSPPDTNSKAVAPYNPPGRPVAREPELTLGVRRNSAAHTTEPASAPPRGRKEDPVHTTPPIGSAIEHRMSGQRGTVVGHQAHGFGHAVPQVVWQGEEASWPQGVAANAVRVVGSTPSDLYTYNQDATSSRPMRGTGGGQGQ